MSTSLVIIGTVIGKANLIILALHLSNSPPPQPGQLIRSWLELSLRPVVQTHNETHVSDSLNLDSSLESPSSYMPISADGRQMAGRRSIGWSLLIICPVISFENNIHTSKFAP